MGGAHGRHGGDVADDVRVALWLREHDPGHADVDGASTWQRFTRITLPLLTPAILVALIFRTLDALRIFDLPYVLTQGQNGTSTLSTIAQETFATNRIYGLGSAMAVLTFIVVMIVSFSYIRFVGGNLRGLAEE